MDFTWQLYITIKLVTKQLTKILKIKWPAFSFLLFLCISCEKTIMNIKFQIPDSLVYSLIYSL